MLDFVTTALCAVQKAEVATSGSGCQVCRTSTPSRQFYLNSSHADS